MAKKRAKKKVAPTVARMPDTADISAIARSFGIGNGPTIRERVWTAAQASGVLLLMVVLAAGVYWNIAGPAQAAPIDSAAIIAAQIGLSAVDTPSPAPSPQPSGKCTNCNGTGKVGDSVTMLDCAVCDGKGYTSSQGPSEFCDCEECLCKPCKCLEPATPKATSVASPPPASLEPKAASPASSCADGSCGVGGFRPFGGFFRRGR